MYRCPQSSSHMRPDAFCKLACKFCDKRLTAYIFIDSQVSSLATQNRYYKKSAAFCLRAVARHSPQLAQAVVECGALESLVACLEEFDPGVKESAAWALGYVAGHNAELAQKVMLRDSGRFCTEEYQPGNVYCQM